MPDEEPPSNEAKKAALAAEAYDTARDAMRAYNIQLRATIKAHGEESTQVAALKTRYDDLSDSLRNATIAQAEANGALQLAQEQGRATAKGLGALIGLNESYETSMLGSVAAILKGGEAQKKFRDQMSKTFTAQNIGYSILLKIGQATMKLAYDQDKALVSFNKQTGAARIYGKQLLDLESRMFDQGVTLEDASEAMTALVRSVYGLKTMSQSAQTDLIDTTAILQELGVSADTTGSNVHFMTRSLGMGVKESVRYQRELLTLAQQIGMPPQEMAEGFKSAQPKLAAFGKDAGRVFKKLAVAARASQMDVQQLLEIVEQFDTFEGAATSVGKLNALLGGPFLNSMEMVMQTDPTERMRMLSGALNDAGKSFDQMTYYEKKSIAAAAGLSDVNELALVMAGNFEGAAGGIHKSQAAILKLQEQTREMNEIWDELNQVVRMFAFEMRPVIKWIKSGVEAFQAQKEQIKAAIPALTGFATGIMVASGLITAYAAFSAAVLVPGLVTAATAAAGFWVALAGPVGLAMVAFGTFLLILDPLIGGTLETALWGAALAATALAFSFNLAIWPFLAVAVGIAAVVTGLMKLSETLFGTDIGESTLFQGLGKTGHVLDENAAAARRAAKATKLYGRELKGVTAPTVGQLRGNKAQLRAERSRSTALPEARAAATAVTYVSTEAGLDQKSGGSSQTSTSQELSPRKIEVSITTDPLFKRFFNADVLEIVGGRKSPLNSITEGSA